MGFQRGPEGGVGEIFETEKGSSYYRDTDSSLKVIKMRVGKRNQGTKSGVFFSDSSPYRIATLYEGTKYQRRDGEPEDEAGEGRRPVLQGMGACRRSELARQLPGGHSRAQATENSPSKLFHSHVGFPVLVCKTWEKNCCSSCSALPDPVPSGISDHKGSTCCLEPLHCAQCNSGSE